jgi:hypothetical protein
VCRSLNPNNDIAIKSGLRVMPTGDVTQTGQTAKMPITATVDGKTNSGFIGFKQESGVWCFTGPAQS